MTNINIGSMLKVGTIIHGVYRIERYLSSGGFGNTYVASNIEFDEIVAIKEFFMKGVTQRDANSTTVSVGVPENIPQFEEQKEKFKKEARRLRKLKNNHIVRVHDLFEENGTAYYVMDYIDGESLAERLIRTKEPFTENDVRTILLQVLDALEEVHHNNIWHLDLKPGNIMLDKSDHVYLIDFGASKQLHASGGMTTSTALCYTPGYAPNEQMGQMFDRFGPWTDIYALGATVYNLLTNKKPPMPIDIEEDGKDAFVLHGNVSTQMHEMVIWMMTPQRKKRPQNVDEIKETLNKIDIIEDKETPNSSTTYEETILFDEGLKEDNDIIEDENDGKEIRDEAVPLVKASRDEEVSREEDAKGIIETKEEEKNNDTIPPVLITNPVINNLLSNMVEIKGGSFKMGASHPRNSDSYPDEKPVHLVTLSSFSIGRFEVTQEEWKSVMGNNPSKFKGNNLPVEQVSWEDCQAFIKKLNAMTGKKFRLPTEAEWEFAARGGSTNIGQSYSGDGVISEVAWYNDNSGKQPHDVGTKSPNSLGLYDMSGNVWEWCNDWYAQYNSTPQNNPHGPISGTERVRRGGSWRSIARFCRVAYRFSFSPGMREDNVGFRLAL